MALTVNIHPKVNATLLAMTACLTACSSPPATLEYTPALPTQSIDAPIATTPAIVASPAISPTVYTDARVSGYVTGNHVQIGNASANSPIHEMFDLTLEPVNEPVAATLAALPPGDVLVVLEGDYFPAQEPLAGVLVVKNVRQVNVPYTDATPLEATYSHADPAFSLDYPAGWFIEADDEGNHITITNEPQGSVSLRPGREFYDPTLISIGIQVIDLPSAEDYVAQVFAAKEKYVVEVTQTKFARNVDSLGYRLRADFLYGSIDEIEYVMSLGGRVVVFRTADYSEHSAEYYNVLFLERLLATLR